MCGTVQAVLHVRSKEEMGAFFAGNLRGGRPQCEKGMGFELAY